MIIGGGKMDSYLKERVTIYEVALAAKVSLATVSRVINKKGNVTEETRSRVENAIQRLGYIPSSVAQSLATSKTTNIGIILPSPDYSYVSTMMNGMIDVGKIYGYRTSIFTYGEEVIQDYSVIESAGGLHVDGIILYDTQLTNKEIEKLISYNIPLVIIGRNDLVGNKIVSVNVDYEIELAEMIRDYLKKGIENLYYLKYVTKDIHQVENFEKVFIKVFKEFGKEFSGTIQVNSFYSSVYKQFLKRFQTVKNGVYFASRDSLAIAVSNAAIDTGLSIPYDVQTIGIIGSRYSEMHRPTITSFMFDMYEIGTISMRVLTKMLAQEPLTSKQFTYRAKLIRRGTSI